ncbi:MAG: GC-type dockerin domain-anchored protein [Phycisphaerales bacterium JB059]
MGQLPRRLAIALTLVAGSGSSLAQDRAGPRGIVNPERQLTPLPIANLVFDPQTGGFDAQPFEWRPDGSPLWINNYTDPCGTGATVGLMDDPDLDGDSFGDFAGTDPSVSDFPLIDSLYLFWGDVPPNSVITHVVLAYATAAPDTDMDADGIGDGISGLDLTLRFSDNDNGFGNDLIPCDRQAYSGRCCIFEFTFHDLPGSPVGLAPGEIATYLITLDLTSMPSMIFELGDTNGFDDAGTGLSGSAIYGVSVGRDHDSDGFTDFSYQLTFDQSESLSPGATGFLAVADRLEAPGVLNTDPPGVFDGFDVYTAPPDFVCGPAGNVMNFYYESTQWFGGFNCDASPPVPFASGFLELYGRVAPQGCNPADLGFPYHVLDFTDVSIMLGEFAEGDPRADLAPPIGVLDFSDILAFLTAFHAGCP